MLLLFAVLPSLPPPSVLAPPPMALKKADKELSRLADVLESAMAADLAIEARKSALDECLSGLDKLEGEVQRFRARAAEKDPEKAMYGPKMVAKIEVLGNGYDMLRDRLDAALESVMPDYAAHRERTEARRSKMEAEEKQKSALAAAAAAAAAAEAKAAEEAKLAEEAAKAEAEEREKREKAERQARLAEEREARRSQAALMTLVDALDRWQAAAPSTLAYVTGLRVLQSVMQAVAAEPADPKFRHIRVKNEHIRKDLVGIAEGEDCLYALGFRVKKLHQPTKEEYYVLAEPNAEEDIDEWIRWSQALEKDLATITEVLERVQQ